SRYRPRKARGMTMVRNTSSSVTTSRAIPRGSASHLIVARNPTAGWRAVRWQPGEQEFERSPGGRGSPGGTDAAADVRGVRGAAAPVRSGQGPHRAAGGRPPPVHDPVGAG